MKLKKNKFKILFSIIFFLLITELFSYTYIKINPKINLDSDKVEDGQNLKKYYFKPHHYYALEVNPEYISESIKVNQYGLRGKPINEKQKNEIRIACLGGSTTQDMISDEKFTYTNLLETKLNGYYKHKNKFVSVINGGVGTYTTAETLIAYIFKIYHLNPDIIIIYHGINDLITQVYYKKSYPDNRQYRKVWEDKNHNLPDFYYFLKNHFYFFKFIHYVFFKNKQYDVWSVSLNKLDFSDKYDNPESLQNVEKNNFGEYFRYNLQSLITLGLTQKKTIILTTFIGDEKYCTQAEIRGLKKINYIIRKLSADNNIYLFDLEKIYNETPPEKSIFLPEDSVHFNEYGNE
ncbi:SGNH/GDSL hydrolase family protein, partial [Candidatus Dependentiae bacterium]|nr:SGNH/GDSL hydrolase family protein [Candidatus Dependentiae bacterium]